jgi:uncharacterized protein
MDLTGTSVLLRIYIGESDRSGAKPLYQAIVERLRERGVAGATVLRGIEGFGAQAHLHTTRILRLSEDLPILIEAVDREEQIRAILPELDAMVGDGLITMERVEVMAYRASRRTDVAPDPPTPEA